jgi:hypothetical protein
MDSMMLQIEKFVQNPISGPRLTINIGSYSLKKALSKEVSKVYANSGLFMEFQKSKAETVIKKSKSFKQVNFLLPQTKTDSTTPKGEVCDMEATLLNQTEAHQLEEETKDDVKMSSPKLSPHTSFDTFKEEDDPIANLNKPEVR